MRFQELMPDVLHWLGIRRIHRLVSMSNMKYDAIVGSGIEVDERVNIPDELIPDDARVEIDAKTAAGYFTPGPVPDADELRKAKGAAWMGDVTQIVPDTDNPSGAASELRKTSAIRHRARLLLERARAGDSEWFTVHDGELMTAAKRSRCRNSPPLSRFAHSRTQPLAPFRGGRRDRKGVLDTAVAPLDLRSRARAMIDLTVVSVLLDAGAGPDWRYREGPDGRVYNRSEGLGIATWHAFAGGLFSSDPDEPLRVDAARLQQIPTGELAQAFQVDGDNPLVGLDGRVAVLRRLGRALDDQPGVFGPHGRPGGLFDAIVTTSAESVLAHDILVRILASFSGIWPSDNS